MKIITRVITHLVNSSRVPNILSDNVQTKIESDYYALKLEKVTAKDDMNEIYDINSSNFVSGIHMNSGGTFVMDDDEFKYYSKEITTLFSETTKLANNMPNYNMIFVEYKDELDECLAIIKVNHKPALTNKIIEINNDTDILFDNSLIVPNGNSNVTEAIVFNFSKNKVLLAEKGFDFDDNKKCLYISNHILKCKKRNSIYEKLIILEKVVESFKSSDALIKYKARIAAVEYMKLNKEYNQEKVIKKIDCDHTLKINIDELVRELDIDYERTIECNSTEFDKLLKVKIKIDDEFVVDMSAYQLVNRDLIKFKKSDNGLNEIKLIGNSVVVK